MVGSLFISSFRKLASRSFSIPIIVSSVVCGIVIAISLILPSAVDEKVTHLLQLGCLAGIAYVAVVLKRFVEIDGRERTLPKSLACDSQFFDLFKHIAESLS